MGPVGEEEGTERSGGAQEEERVVIRTDTASQYQSMVEWPQRCHQCFFGDLLCCLF